MLRFLFGGALALSSLAANAHAGMGQDPPRSAAADSARLHRSARSQQADFERTRRNRLPEVWRGGSGGCDERIGRFCLTHSRGRSNWTAPPEHPEVIVRRNELIENLERTAELIPGDDWVAGQWVRYLVEAGRFDQAIVAARGCRAEPAWCAALAGFTYHYAARPVSADSAFDAALARMEDAERRRWTDLSLILDERSARSYRRLPPEENAAFEQRFWRLADPLLTRPGNELRAEHLSRHVWDQLQYRAQSADGIAWGFDLREILIRYGWPSGWERTRETTMTLGPPALISHYASAPQSLLPPSSALIEEPGVGGVWDVEEPRSRTGYNVPLADSVAQWFTPLAHQTAVFRRGDEAVVVAAYELPADSVPADAAIEAGLALLPTAAPLEAPVLAVLENAGRSGVITSVGSVQPLLLSLEVIVPGERRIARARHGLRLQPLQPGEVAISDLLLLDGAGPLPDSLAPAAARARGSGRVLSGEQVAIYWEMYGVNPRRTPSVTMSLRLVDGGAGWLRRLAQRAGLVREVAPIRLRWDEPVAPGSYSARSLAIQIPDVSPGQYLLELTAEVSGHDPVVIHRELEIIAAPNL